VGVDPQAVSVKTSRLSNGICFMLRLL
jgi:hypothetical protein